MMSGQWQGQGPGQGPGQGQGQIVSQIQGQEEQDQLIVYLKQAFCGFIRAKEGVEMEHLGEREREGDAFVVNLCCCVGLCCVLSVVHVLYCTAL